MFDDFKELLSAFNAYHVRYLIVGGYAVSLHAQPRATKDLDILISADAENGRAVYAALAKFGAPVEGLSASDFTEPDSFFRMGTPPVMVDIIPKISGVEFDTAWQRRVNVPIDDTLTVPFISPQDLLAAKISAGRAQDLADVAALRESIGHYEIDERQMSPGDSRAMQEIQAAQAQGREDWLKLRRQQAIKSAAPSSERSLDREDNDETKDSGKGADDDLAS